MKTLFFFICVIILSSIVIDHVYSAYCHGKPDPNAKPNMNPIYTGKPTLVNSVKNGKHFTVGEGEDSIDIIHVYGTPYEMGLAHGQLMKDKLKTFFDKLWNYILDQIEESIKFLPDWLQKMIAEKGIDFALDFTYELTKEFTGKYFYEEMRGVSDGGGVDFDTMRRVHLIGELTKGACSMMGAWGDATLNRGTLQLRAFDWDVNGPYKDYPAIVVYHPNEGSGNGHSFANIGFVGWLGSFSGMSSQQMAISEIGVSYPDPTFEKESRIGVPFTFLLRDILQFDNTLQDSINRIKNANRTCNLILGVGDAKANSFRAFQYSYSVANVIDDKNLIPANDTWHPKIDSVVYFGMDWLCPSFTETMANQIKKYHGSITAETTLRYIVPITCTGNLQVAVYDLTNNLLYVSYARASYESGPQYAYQRQYLRLNMTELFHESQ